MHVGRQLLATLARGEGSYLNARAPTGLTGILTHPSPRPHLIYLYRETLKRLSDLPEHSAYRQSTEALTKHRLQIIEDTKPDGLDAWKDRIRSQIEMHTGWSRQLAEDMANGRGYLPQKIDEQDEREVEWDDDVGGDRAEGPRDPAAVGTSQAKDFGVGRSPEELNREHTVLEDEPPLTAMQISDIEQKLSAGLLEEVVIVARRELDLIDTMKENAVWEELEEKPVEGQWSYFERDAHVGKTQAP